MINSKIVTEPFHARKKSKSVTIDDSISLEILSRQVCHIFISALNDKITASVFNDDESKQVLNLDKITFSWAGSSNDGEKIASKSIVFK